MTWGLLTFGNRVVRHSRAGGGTSVHSGDRLGAHHAPEPRVNGALECPSSTGDPVARGIQMLGRIANSIAQGIEMPGAHRESDLYEHLNAQSHPKTNLVEHLNALADRERDWTGH